MPSKSIIINKPGYEFADYLLNKIWSICFTNISWFQRIKMEWL